MISPIGVVSPSNARLEEMKSEIFRKKLKARRKQEQVLGELEEYKTLRNELYYKEEVFEHLERIGGGCNFENLRIYFDNSNSSPWNIVYFLSALFFGLSGTVLAISLLIYSFGGKVNIMYPVYSIMGMTLSFFLAIFSFKMERKRFYHFHISDMKKGFPHFMSKYKESEKIFKESKTYNHISEQDYEVDFILLNIKMRALYLDLKNEINLLENELESLYLSKLN